MFTHRGLPRLAEAFSEGRSPHQFTPMSGAHQSIEPAGGSRSCLSVFASLCRLPPVAHAPRSAVRFGMKIAYFIIIPLICLCGCSQQSQKPIGKPPAAPPSKYAVRLSAVKVPNATLTDLGLPPLSEPLTIEARKKLAAYVLEHPEDFSILAPTGSVVPRVWDKGQIYLELLPDSTQEARDFEKLGMATTQFVPGVAIQEVEANGEILYDCFCSSMVHLKKPIANNNSLDIGQGGGVGTGLLAVGQPEIWPLLQGDVVTLWLLVVFNPV